MEGVYLLLYGWLISAVLEVSRRLVRQKCGTGKSEAGGSVAKGSTVTVNNVESAGRCGTWVSGV